MQTRKAATLVEVLVAMFAGALGMISLLALIPLGLLNMAESVRDYRIATAAANAEAIAEMEHLNPTTGRTYTLRNDETVRANAGTSNVVFADPIGMNTLAAPFA